MYSSAKARKLFQCYGFTIRPTGSDSSHQLGPVERTHRTVANSVRAQLIGANIDIRFWPYCFDHTLRLLNANSCAGMDSSRLEAVYGRRDNFKNLKYFGSRVWCRPPDDRDAKFKSNLRKSLFLVFLPDTTKNIFYYDQESNQIKKAGHFRFDEGFNDLPLQEQPPNVINLRNSNNGIEFPIDPPEYSTAEDLDFFTSPFAETHTQNINITCDDSTFGLTIDSDETSNRAFISKISSKRTGSVVKHFKFHNAARKNLKGFYIVAINDRPCFEKDYFIDRLCTLSNNHAINFEITVAFDHCLLADERWRSLEELDLYTPPQLPHPDSPATDDFSPDLLIEDICHIATLRPSWFKAERNESRRIYDDDDDDDDVSISSDDSMTSLDPNDPNAAFSPAYLSTKAISLAMNAIQSSHTTPAEHALGSFTCRKLQKLDTWLDWKQGEISQLDKMAKLGMYGKPCKAPCNAIILCPHWQYHLKRTGD